MENIVKMINGRIHTAGCTLSCDYCCLAQVEHKNDWEPYALKYPLETVLKACSKERLGGDGFYSDYRRRRDFAAKRCSPANTWIAERRAFCTGDNEWDAWRQNPGTC